MNEKNILIYLCKKWHFFDPLTFFISLLAEHCIFFLPLLQFNIKSIIANMSSDRCAGHFLLLKGYHIKLQIISKTILNSVAEQRSI